MNLMNSEIERILSLSLKRRNIPLKLPEMVQANSSGPDNSVLMVNGSFLTQISLPLKELNTSTKSTLEPNIIMTHMMLTHPPYRGIYSNIMTPTICPTGITTGISRGRDLTSLRLLTLHTALARSLIFLPLWFLVLMVTTII